MGALDRPHRQGSAEAIPDTPLGVVAKGALAGLAGTLALGAAMKAAQGVADRGGGDGRRPDDAGAELGIGAAQALAGGQVQAPFLDRSTEIFVQKVATGLFGASLPASARATAGAAMHVVYGGFWGAVYGLVQSSLRLPPGPHGVLYGLVVWLVGPVTLVPAMGIMPPLREQGTRRVLMLAGLHAAYGLVLSLVFDAFARRERR